MQHVMILSIVTLLASTSGVLAEAEADLRLPVDRGTVAGEAANDTVACGMRLPADPWVGASDACIVASATPTRPSPVDVTTARINPHETAPVTVTKARRNPHEITPTRPAPVDEASLPIISE